MLNLKTFVLLVSLFLVGSAHAEQKKTLGKWDVHYIAINTTFLTPDVAKAYGIVRSKNQALVNISVLDRRTKEAQVVTMSGIARDLLGKQTQLEFAKVVDGQAIYYLATMPFEDQERYRFNIKIEQDNNNQSLQFEQKLYRE